MSAMLTLFLPDADATERLGGAIAQVLSDATEGAAGRGATIWLDGDLGAGKTTLARGLLRALGLE